MDVFLLPLFLLFILPQKAPSGETWEELLHLDGLSLSFTVSPGSGTDGPRHLLLGDIFSIRALQDYSWTGALGRHCSPRKLPAKAFEDSWHTEKTMCYSCYSTKKFGYLWPIKKSHLIIVGFDGWVLWLCGIFCEGRNEQRHVCNMCKSCVFIHFFIVNTSNLLISFYFKFPWDQ